MKKIATGNLLTKREDKFKEISGRKRLQKYEKKILKILTPSEFLKTKEEELDPKTYQRRINQISKEYGPLTKEQEKELKYLTPGQFRRLNPKITTPIPKKPDPIPLSSMSIEYDDLPRSIKRMDHNGFLYENGFFSGSPVNLGSLISSYDLTTREFFQILFSGDPTYIYDPENTGEDVLYDRHEWEEYENERNK